jgi:hypothetical protein
MKTCPLLPKPVRDRDRDRHTHTRTQASRNNTISSLLLINFRTYTKRALSPEIYICFTL